VDIAQNAICELLAEAPASQQPKQTDYSTLKQAGQAGQGAQFGGIPGTFGGPAAFYGGGGGYTPPAAPQARAPPMEYASFVATLPTMLTPDDQLQRYQDYLRSYAASMQQQPAMQQIQQIQQPQPQHAGAGGTISHVLPLPDKIISGIIGKGGSVIREIASRSGAQVRVSQKDTITAAGERNVMIEGRPDAVAAAQHLISERCREIEADVVRKVGGGGGGGAFPPQAQYQQPAASYGYGGYGVASQQFSCGSTSGFGGYPTPQNAGLAGAPAPPGYQISNPQGGGY